MEKNCGKTECLNYIIRRMPLDGRRVCVTSIGLDGERTDQVTRTPKPEIVLREGMFFSTSETHYRARRGRLITAKVVSEGKVILSGPSSTASLRRWMDGLSSGFGIDLTIIDGALSRKSSASPAVSDAMVLATGAALSSSLSTLVDLTAFCVGMIRLPLAETHPDTARSVTVSSMAPDVEICEDTERVDVTGALTDRLLARLTQDGGLDRYEVVVEDFTRIFVTPGQYRSFVRAGGRLRVRRRTVLLAVCVNPLAPNGYRLDSELLCARLSDKLQIPVYDIKRHEA